jgi:hypothetical protein
MVAVSPRSHFDDPRKLRDLIGRVADLANQHELTSVIVGMTGDPSDLDFPEIVDFVESELRVEDAIFRMTRERIVLFVADVDESAAREIMERILIGFQERASTIEPPQMGLRYFEVRPSTLDLSVKRVLPALFVQKSNTH